MIVNVIQNRLNNNLLFDYENKTNVCTLWKTILINYKFKNFDILNNLYRQLLKLNFNQYKNAFNFVARLKNIHIDIFNVSSHFKLKINFFIFLFYIDLSKAYNDYFTHYIQNHKSINDINIESAFSLKYVIRRFINIVINSFSEREKFNYVFFAQRLFHRLIAFFSKQRYIIIDSQKGVVKDLDDHQVLKFIKWCTHCKTIFYIKIEYDKLENRPLKKENNNNNNNNVNVKNNNDNKFKNKNNDDKNFKKRRRNNNDVNREIYVVYIIEINISKSKRWVINYAASQHFITNKNAFIKYRSLNSSINNVRSIKNINKSKILIDIEKIRLIINLRGRKKEIIFNDVFYISKLFINFIFQK